jgi:hypothetical protein
LIVTLGPERIVGGKRVQAKPDTESNGVQPTRQLATAVAVRCCSSITFAFSARGSRDSCPDSRSSSADAGVTLIETGVLTPISKSAEGVRLFALRQPNQMGLASRLRMLETNASGQQQSQACR